MPGNPRNVRPELYSSLPEVLQDGTETSIYVPLGLISQTDGSGNQQYFLDNGLGSTEALTDGSGNVVATYKYDVFGAVRSSTGSSSTDFRFTGQQNDAAVGYTYLRARYYDPATGRFLSKDPVRGNLANPASLHYYGYGYNNPVNYTDPSGRCLEDACIVEGILVYTAVVGVIALWEEYNVTHQAEIQDAGEACGEAIQAAIDNASMLLAERNPAQDTKLTPGEIKRLQEGGINIEDLKGGKHAGQRDLYKDKNTGRIYVKPKGGRGPGEDTGLNINDF